MNDNDLDKWLSGQQKGTILATWVFFGQGYRYFHLKFNLTQINYLAIITISTKEIDMELIIGLYIVASIVICKALQNYIDTGRFIKDRRSK